MGVIVCPKCGLNDKIEKVGGIVARGTTEMRASGPTSTVFNVGGDWGSGGGWTTLTGVQVTDLAKSLAPPPDPREGAGFVWFVMGIGWFAALVMLFEAIFAYGSLILGDSPEAIAGGFFGAVGSGAVAYYIFKKNSSRKAEARAQVPSWEAELAKWNRSYYCARDHLVFDPETAELADQPQPTLTDEKSPEHFV